MEIEWISVSDAAALIGVNKTTIRSRSKASGWPIEKRPRPDNQGGGPLCIFVRRSDVEEFGRDRLRKRTEKNLKRSDKGNDVRRIVEWADALTEWPTDEEIEARTTDIYRYPDIVSAIETRVFRKNTKGEYLEPLRLPAMNTDGMQRKVIGRAGGLEDTIRIVVQRRDDDES